MGYSRKKFKQGVGGRGWGYGVSSGIKEIACGIPRDQLKTKWNFQGWLRKNNVKFPGVFVFGLGISKGSDIILWNIQGLRFALSWISRGKVKKWKIPGAFSKKYILNCPPPPHPSPCLGSFWNSPIYLWVRARART